MFISKATLFGFSILIAGTIAIIRHDRINRVIFPFILCVWIGSINEILSYFLWEAGHSTLINNNIYVLAEAILFLIFFKNIGIFEKYLWLFGILITGWIGLWFWENLILGKINFVSSRFRITYSFGIVLMGITGINKLMLLDINKPIGINSSNIFKNPVFLICIGSIVFFTFKLIVEIFWLYGLNASKDFRLDVYDILIYINLIVNLVYALAVLWIPAKQQYILL